MKRSPQWKTVQRWRTSGQALILIVLTFFGLLLFLGLMVDLGQIFLAKGYLRRAADSAALAAAAQFRTDTGDAAVTLANMTNAAKEAAKMNGINDAKVTVQTCGTTPSDSVLCAEPNGMPQKLVRVTITLWYPMSFLQIIGYDHIVLTESSISEAASMDVVLVIDTSESMSWDLRGRSQPVGKDPTDPSYCNDHSDLPDPDKCEPFGDVKEAAATFAANILNKSNPNDEEDRLAIVSFASGWDNPPLGTYVVQDWTSDISVAAQKIKDLKVYNPPYKWTQGDDYPDPMPLGPVRLYDTDGTYMRMKCLSATAKADPKYYSACGTTNIGGALTLAGAEFGKNKRPQALWVVVLLTDGAADATFGTYEDKDGISGNPKKPYLGSINPADFEPNLPLGFCPELTWIASGHLCQDGTAGNYHGSSSDQYDANDYAMDQGDYVACPAVLASPPTGCSTTGVGAIIFTIGLGGEIVKMDTTGTKPYGGTLLRYLAAVGDDGDPSTDPCDHGAAKTDWTLSCGNYFYAQENGTDLLAIFAKIYSRIFTRLTV